MTKKELNKILKDHCLWLEGNPDGKCADLSGADLSDVDLRCANLSGANLSDADLRCANLSGAGLPGANLSDANLSDANLSDADLRCANLSDADLRCANLSGADLSGAKLSDANLSDADLRCANLRCANLSDVDLRCANLSDVDLSGANLSSANLSDADIEGVKYDARTAFFALACPEAGAFIGYKKCGCYIVRLRITENAKRSSATSRKCRCSEAEVISINYFDGAPADILSVSSNWDSAFIYTVGETVRVDNFCDDRWRECAPGIHFFITREEAVQYR